MSNSSENVLPVTQRTKIKRVPQRGQYERQVIYDILDEGLVCHVGFAVDGQPFVIPTAYGRVGDRLYIHGSPASRMLRSLQNAIEVCVTVTLLDGLVLARSAFHHSMNYRSVVIFGTATTVESSEEKLAALHTFTEHVMSGRWAEVRPPSLQELQGTLVLSLLLDEASAKVRTGPPLDDEADYSLSVWAGVLPLQQKAGVAIPDPHLHSGISLPDYVQNYTRTHSK
ncbi:flavin-nucleotide-binding protein [Fischerella major NIES-592]|uniref:Flavin-nucleotide-binding protein n=1 Tax=Fischerella major NIES-592 TaxID=210994 RepID=A0A1U7GXQ9_9CYAN|nr:pyridoxamine 5'-phosphate oxidase family protein [Fischerella major]OKH13134.1 flavin-nucleotide-binding protein [Fischerella major NIES-592]